MNKTKITEIRETYTVKSIIKGEGLAIDGTKFENITSVRFKPVATVEGGARFWHYILDTIIYNGFATIVGVPIVLLLVFLGVDISMLTDESVAGNLLDRMVSWLILYPGYYILFESTLQSTPGKLILGRIVVDEYGEKPSFMTIVKRSYIRIIPFETFSCFSGLGWHDSWSETMVIRKKDLEELKLALKVQEFDAESNINEQKI